MERFIEATPDEISDGLMTGEYIPPFDREIKVRKVNDGYGCLYNWLVA